MGGGGGGFLGIGGAIGDFFDFTLGAVIGLTAIVIDSIFGTDLKTAIAPIMSLFGFEDEEIVTRYVATTKIMQDDQEESATATLLLRKVRNNLTAKDFILGYKEFGNLQYNKYFNHGSSFIDGLPDAVITAVSANPDAVKEYINSNVSHTGTLTFSFVRFVIPSDEDWAKYKLQELYGYDVEKDLVKINNTWYEYNSCSYVTTGSNANTLNVVIGTVKETTTNVYTTTKVTVTSLSSTQDTVTTITHTDTIVTKTDNSAILSSVGVDTNTTTQTVTKDSVTASTTTVLNSSTDNTNTVSTLTYNVPYHNNNNYYWVLYTDTGTDKSYYWMYDSTNISEDSPLYPNAKRSIGIYEDEDDTTTGSTQYTFKGRRILGDGVNTYTKEEAQEIINNKILKAMPIVMLRNGFYNIDSTNSNRPPTIDAAGKRLKSSREQLDSINVDLDNILDGISENSNLDTIQDAFFLFGVAPKYYDVDTNGDKKSTSDEDMYPEEVSAVLYEMFNLIYEEFPYVADNEDNDSKSFTFSVRENPFHMGMAWVNPGSSTTTGTIKSLLDTRYATATSETPANTSHDKRTYAHYVDKSPFIYDESGLEEICTVVTKAQANTEEGTKYSDSSSSIWWYQGFFSTDYMVRVESYKVEYYYDKNLESITKKIRKNKKVSFYTLYNTRLNEGNNIFYIENNDYTNLHRINKHTSRERVEGTYDEYIETVYYTVTDYEAGVPRIDSLAEYLDNGTLPSDTSATDVDILTLTMMKQISNTQYKTIYAHGIVHFNLIKENPNATGDDAKTAYISNSLDSRECVIPLTIISINSLSYKMQCKLLDNSTYLVFYGKQVTHLQWYETEAFNSRVQIVLIVLQIVLIVLTVVFTAGTTTWQTMALTEILKQALTILIITALVTLSMYAIQEYVQNTGLKILLTIGVMVLGTLAGKSLLGKGGLQFTTGELTLAGLGMCVKAADIYSNDMMKLRQEELAKRELTQSDYWEDMFDTLEDKMDELTTTVDVVTLANMINTDYSTDNDRIGVENIDTVSSISESYSLNNISTEEFFRIATSPRAFDSDVLFNPWLPNELALQQFKLWRDDD